MVTQVILPGLVLFLLVVIDIFAIEQTTIIPLGCTVFLTILALYMRPYALAFWGAISVILVFGILQFGQSLDLDTRMNAPSEWSILVRTAGSIAMSGIMIILSVHREKLRHRHTDIFAVLTQLPLPVILSDDSATITYLNNRAAEMLDLSPEQGVGMNYFELLLYQSGKGEMIRQYVDLIDASDTDSIDINVRLRNRPTKLLKGMLVALKTRNGSQVITLITENYATSAVLYAMAVRMAARKNNPLETRHPIESI